LRKSGWRVLAYVPAYEDSGAAQQQTAEGEDDTRNLFRLWLTAADWGRRDLFDWGPRVVANGAAWSRYNDFAGAAYPPDDDEDEEEEEETTAPAAAAARL
jgi:hypothetical protein